MTLLEEYCPGWQKNGLTIYPFYCYTYDRHHMLLNPECGTTLFLDDNLENLIKPGCITEDLAFLFVQRGLATYDNSRPPLRISHPQFPHFFMLDLTQNCNLNCLYCFRELSRQPVCMSDDMLLKICHHLIAYWQRHPEIQLHIQAWGGEPLLLVDQIAMIRHAFDEAGMNPNIEIETNGTLIDEQIAKQLRELRIHIGVSIDGDPIVQNQQRPTLVGKPTSKRVELGIASLRKYYGDEFGSITVVTQNTAARLHEILDYFVNTLHLTGIKFNPLRETGDYRHLSLSEAELAVFEEKLLGELINYVKSGVRIVEQNICQRLRNIVYRPCDNICNSCGCQGGYAMVVVDHNGDVYPCEMSDFPDLRIGKIDTEFIEDMVNIPSDHTNRYFAPREFAQCKGCPWHFYCRGGCKSASLFSTGHTQIIDKAECVINRTLYPLLIQLLMEEPDIASKLMGNA